MPKLGADMTAGTLVAWLKQPGDAVSRGDIVAQVETDKGVIDVEIFATGVLEQIRVQPGEKVPVGAVLATVSTSDAETTVPHGAAALREPGTAARSTQTTTATPAAPSFTESVASRQSLAAATMRLRMSPSARRLARERGVDPAQITGTGPGGAVTRKDVLREAPGQQAPADAASPPTPAPVSAAPAASDQRARMRAVIAAAMSRSKREIPHYYLSNLVDLERALTWLAEQNRQRPVTERLLIGVLYLKAVALALREVPELNALWNGTGSTPSADIHVGAAVTLRQGGLVAPALHHTDRQSLDELMRSFRDLVSRARAGALRSSELSDPTITVTSLGEQGVDAVFGIIYPPQVALVGIGKVVERPWVVDGQIVARHVVQTTLSADHRVTDGHRGAVFLAALARLLQEPEKL